MLSNLTVVPVEIMINQLVPPTVQARRRRARRRGERRGHRRHLARRRRVTRGGMVRT